VQVHLYFVVLGGYCESLLSHLADLAHIERLVSQDNVYQGQNCFRQFGTVVLNSECRVKVRHAVDVNFSLLVASVDQGLWLATLIGKRIPVLFESNQVSDVVRELMEDQYK